MKKYLLLLITILLLHINKSQAQYVTIPDTNFVAWLNANGYASCMNGNMMDTTCGAVVNATSVDCYNSNISDLTGIEYFDNLDTLWCSYNQLTSLPALPSSLTYLFCNKNQLASLPVLPNSLTYLRCEYNQLTSLPALPNSLTDLYCDNNQLTSLPILPDSLTFLVCYFNQLTSLPVLPNSLTFLVCYFNQLASLPVLPNSLSTFNCQNNHLNSLPALPNSLTSLTCSYNQLTTLPALPNSLTVLNCSWNFLTSLPILPNSLAQLSCSYNSIISLPILPNSLTNLFCEKNNLSTLPPLPDSMQYLYCKYNNKLNCLPKLNRIINFEFTNTGIQCLPNYGNVTNSSPNIYSMPLCDLFNTNGCDVFWNIGGNVYSDDNTNCIADTNETKLSFIKLNLYTNGNLIQSTYSNNFGQYSFDIDSGLFAVAVDTTGLSITVACPANFYDTNYVAHNDSLFDNRNFAVECKPGFDVGVKTILQDHGIFRPANFANVKILAGDMSNNYGLHCAAGVSGTVQVVISGPATYIGTVNGALTPLVNGDTLTYTIADFALFDFNSDIQIKVQTDTLAQMNDLVCFAVGVTPTLGDINASNNTLQQCFTVVNSYDPNDKTVWPTNEILASDGKLTYTIRFQNTGNAPAQHIYIMDTLAQELDAATFELLAYSHQPQVQLIGNILRFNFPNINLPDSTNDEPNSHGYVQFCIKIKDSIALGTTISNTSFIYFDFNPPVVTNTTSNELIDCDNLVMQHQLTPTSLCKNDTMNAFIQLHYNYNYIRWYVDNVFAAAGDTVNLTNFGLGTHIIKTVIKTPYCLVKLYDTVTVNDLPQPNLGSDTTVCGGVSITTSGAYANYLWSIGATTATVFANTTATYIVTVTDVNGCQGSDILDVIVNPLPLISFNAFVIDTLCKNAGIQTIIAPTPIGGTLTGNGLIGLYFDPSAVSNGWNYFMYIYTDSNSCTNTATDSVWVDDCLSINLLDANIYFMIAPNPTNDNITITTNLQSTNCTAILYDMLGKELKSQKLNSNHTQINLTGLSEGNYMLKVMDGESLVGVKRVLKMK